MSRVGKKPVLIPEKVTVTADGQQISVAGPRGTLRQRIPPEVVVRVDGTRVIVDEPKKTRGNLGYQGLTRALIAGMVEGVTGGYRRVLEITGVGYKADVSNGVLTLTVGYSHPVAIRIPKDIQAKVDKNIVVTLEGMDKQVVGELAAQIRRVRPPEPYQGKGIKYAGEEIIRKVGKTGAK